MDSDRLGDLLKRAADEVSSALSELDDWSLADTAPGQYRHDIVDDAAVHRVLDPAGVGVLSEESGLTRGDAELVVVVDPVDGSTNASMGIPWYAVSLCAFDAAGPLAAVVTNLATAECFEAERGRGATRDGESIGPSSVSELSEAVVVLNALPDVHWGWRQYRTLGACALDLCGVACGRFDGYVDFDSRMGPWDYAGGLLVCREAGAVVADRFGRELACVDENARRAPIAAATPDLFKALTEAVE